MAQLQPGIQVEVTPIKHEVYFELGKNLSTLLDECTRRANDSSLPFEMVIKQGETRLKITVNK